MKLIFLFGPPASGKLTVAKAAAVLTGLPVFHNHLVVDAVAAVFPFGSPPFVHLRERFWLETFREAADAGRSLIFTFAPEPTVNPAFPDEARSIVTGGGGEVDFVRLTVPPEVQEARIADPSREAHGKLRSLDLLRQLSSDFARCDAAMPAPRLTIDTAQLAPSAAARRIVAALGLAKAPPGRR